MHTPTIRLLFVDNEDNVLDGIRRLLRRQAYPWELLFATSAEAAIVLMEAQPIDVLVTDMRMPAMQGDELLRYTAKHYPSTARLVLSAAINLSDNANILQYAHQCLTKPCEADALRKAIDASLQTLQLIHAPRIRAALGDITRIPSMPRVYQELETAIQNQATSHKEIANIFASDMALSAKLLQLVNSSFFGLSRRISKLDDAVILLGFERLRGLVLCNYVFEAFHSPPDCCNVSIDYLWKNAFTTAKLARAISVAEHEQLDGPDQAYLSGLMHNLGLLLFATKMPKKLQLVINKLADDTTQALTLEQQILGATHAEAGAYLLSLWTLPPRIIEGVLFQHQPMLLNNNLFCSVTAVHIAVALMAEDETGIEKAFAHELDEAYIQQLGLTGRIPAWQALKTKIKAEIVAN
ncbi:MAG: response regulator [Methylococcaceae bacterium]|jgi:HD-like signal output (HDOD) protein